MEKPPSFADRPEFRQAMEKRQWPADRRESETMDRDPLLRAAHRHTGRDNRVLRVGEDIENIWSIYERDTLPCSARQS